MKREAFRLWGLAEDLMCAVLNKQKKTTKKVKQTTCASFAYMTFTATLTSEFSFHL